VGQRGRTAREITAWSSGFNLVLRRAKTRTTLKPKLHALVSLRVLAPAQALRHFFAYFQLRDLPSDIHSTEVSSRFFLVSSVLASVIHSRYSFLLL
jgi:hypothetical protein